MSALSRVRREARWLSGVVFDPLMPWPIGCTGCGWESRRQGAHRIHRLRCRGHVVLIPLDEDVLRQLGAGRLFTDLVEDLPGGDR